MSWNTWAQAHGLSRPRLLTRLAEPANVTLVVAPAGSGKTTLLAQYARASRTPAAWYRAEPEDASPDKVQARLAAVLAAVDAESPAMLVIDDFHVLMETPAEAAADHFLNHAPPGLRIFVASRRVPTLNLSRAELGTVTVLTADDLRFRAWEVERLFAEVYREPLPPRDAAALTRRTEGWAASLQLFHLSTRGRPLADRRGAITGLSRRSRFARSYLARTVLDELPRELQDFLRLTCVFDVLTAERCDRLLGTANAQRRLEYLARQQALTTSDDGGHTFRYHEVLRRHLESALVEQLGPARTREWYALAARLLEEEGALSEALRVYARAERWPDAARLLRADGARVVDGATAAGWADLLPAWLVDEDPWLSLAAGRQLAVAGRLTEAVLRYRQAEQLFADLPDREVAVRERRLVELWTGGPARPHLHWADRLRAALQRQPAATVATQDDEGARDGVGDVLCRALALLLTGNVAGAAALLEEAAEPENGFLGYATRLAATAIAGLRGLQCATAVERLAGDAEHAGVTWVARQCRAVGALVAEVTEEADRGTDPMRRLVAECERSADLWGALLVTGMDGLRRLLRGEPSVHIWHDAATRCHALGAGSLDVWASAFGALAAAVEGLPDAAAADRAERTARANGIAGAEAIALLARAGHDVTRRQDLVVPARDLAQQHGMPWPEQLEERLLRPHRHAGPENRATPLGPPVSVVRDHAPPVRLRCFGGFALSFADRDLDWRQLRPRAATMLRLLSVHAGRAVHRETLIVALWPDVPVGQATRNLQVAVSSLRRFLEPGAPRGRAQIVVRHGDAYAVVPPPGSDVDVVTFIEALQDAQRARFGGSSGAERQALRRAVSVYGGELLPEDGPAEWVVAERERLRVQAGTAAGRLAELEIAQGEHAAAAAAARNGLEIEPFQDASWRLLIRAYDTLGDTAAAERTRRGYADMLATLGITGPGPPRPRSSPEASPPSEELHLTDGHVPVLSGAVTRQDRDP